MNSEIKNILVDLYNSFRPILNFELLINGKPPAMPGDSQSLTFSEVAR